MSLFTVRRRKKKKQQNEQNTSTIVPRNTTKSRLDYIIGNVSFTSYYLRKVDKNSIFKGNTENVLVNFIIEIYFSSAYP